MGRYSLGVLAAASTYQASFMKGLKIIGVYNANIADNKTWQEQLKHLIVDIELVGLDLAGIDSRADIKECLEANRRTLGNYVNSLGHEGGQVTFFAPVLLDDTVYACFPGDGGKIRKIAVFYDLIPYLFWDRYLTTEQKRREYFLRLKDLFLADVILCDSATTANDLSRFLFIPHEKLRVLKVGSPNTVPTESLGKATEQQAKSKEVRDRLKGKKFILSVSGDDMRKNNIRMVQGFDKFNRLHDNEYTLVITSNFSEGTKQLLNNLSKQLYFTNSVSSEDLVWLYEQSLCVLFVPEYEGLGLPILEALEYKKPVIVSDIEVFRELSTEAMIFADHEDVSDIASKLHEQVISHWLPPDQAVKRLLDDWSWKNTATTFVDALKSAFLTKPDTGAEKRIAILAPHPSGISSIGRFVQEHHALLSQYADPTYYLERSPTVDEERIAYLPYVADCRPIESFARSVQSEQYDKVIYHIGNSDYHLATFSGALAVPGTVILHDTKLSGLASAMVHHNVWDKTRHDAEMKLSRAVSDKHKQPSVDSATSLVNTAEEVIVHSEYAAEAVRNALAAHKQKVRVLQHPMVGPPYWHKQKNGSVMLKVGLAGILNAAKGTDLLELLLKNPKSNQGVIYHLFGYGFATDPVQLVSLYSLGPIIVETDLPDLAFQNKLRSMDVLLTYRPQYHGEASRAALEAMRYGVVPIVRNIGWFAQLPDNACIKINAPLEAVDAVNKLQANPKLLAEMSDNAAKYVNEICTVQQYVAGVLHDEAG